jgi:hypothetical protein
MHEAREHLRNKELGWSEPSGMNPAAVALLGQRGSPRCPSGVLESRSLSAMGSEAPTEPHGKDRSILAGMESLT